MVLTAHVMLCTYCRLGKVSLYFVGKTSHYAATSWLHGPADLGVLLVALQPPS